MTEIIQQHLYRVWEDGLNLCGCGNHEAVWQHIGHILSIIAASAEDLNDVGRMVTNYVGSAPGAEIILSRLEHAGLIGHSSYIMWPMITPKGRWIIHALNTINEYDSDYGSPHNGKPCTDDCWIIPTGQQP